MPAVLGMSAALAVAGGDVNLALRAVIQRLSRPRRMSRNMAKSPIRLYQG